MRIQKGFGKLVLLFGLVGLIVLAGCSNNGNNGGNDGGSEAAQGFDNIVGIEAGAGVVAAAENAVKAEYGDGQKGYDLDVEVVPSSSAAMAASLASAVEKKEWVVVTGWTPHWMFAAYDLKYLEDPLGVFGGDEAIHTIVRKGLKEEKPQAYEVLDRFSWETSDMESIMLDIYENETDPRDAAKAWVDANRDKVDPWIDGVEPVDGEKLKLVYVAWDSEIASTNMIALVLEEIGYQVEITPVDNTPMWQAIASGSHDGMVAAWLPGTHGPQWEEFKDDVVDLGPNLEGAKIGLVVPSYVDITSIADIKKK